MAVGAGYVRGMVVNVDLPRLDAPGSWKERPALIVSTEDFHRTRPDDLLAALVTHRIWKYHGSTDYLLQDWQAAGLTQPSVVRSSLYLLLCSDVKSVRGSLTSRDLQGVEASLRRALGL
ncbi:MAG: type II toxin-antitoxin system PemK/MazF family toxin [Deltaproteobacteria bacterium]|nr:type II toxin-antitoxin system PemK/MazF family toxin [Deltaproteobacteria bacterium]